jgi:gas vesicle protein
MGTQGRFWSGVALGGAVGVAMGMLFAQEPGTDFRRRLKSRISELAGRARSRAQEFAKTAQDAAPSGVREAVEDLSAAAQDLGAGVALGVESVSGRLSDRFGEILREDAEKTS